MNIKSGYETSESKNLKSHCFPSGYGFSFLFTILRGGLHFRYSDGLKELKLFCSLPLIRVLPLNYIRFIHYCTTIFRLFFNWRYSCFTLFSFRCVFGKLIRETLFCKFTFHF
uniref:Uncharacterized protein n=1 Tax=Lepeophtheirus salmonis TaxID=72036 RepID=A0A0K2T366_LEPSM